MSEKPIAWLIRESGHQGQAPRVMSGKMFISEDAARAAAMRLTNRHWLRQAFPVFNPTGEQLRGLSRHGAQPTGPLWTCEPCNTMTNYLTCPKCGASPP